MGCASCEGKVPITFYGDFCADGAYSVVLTDDSQSSNNKTVDGSGVACGYGMTNVETLDIKPGQAMTLKVPAATYSTLHINLKVEGCYKVKVDDVEQTDINDTFENDPGCKNRPEKTWSVVVVPKSDNGGSGTGGDGDGGLKSVHWQFSMGGLSSGESAGSLMLSEGAITANSYTPAALRYVSPSAEVDVIRNAGVLQQIKSPECLADIVTLSATKYEIRFYLTGSKVNGAYVPSGSPYVTWTVENPSGAPAGAVSISETRGGITTVNAFTHDAATEAWSYNRGGGRLETLSTMNLVNGDKKVTRTVTDPATGIVALKTIETKHMFAWGMEIVQRIEDPDGSPITTDYTFYENIADGGGYRHVKSFARSDGYWEFYEYSSNQFSYGNLDKTYRPGKDAPATPQINLSNYVQHNYYASSYPGGYYGGVSVFSTVPAGETVTAFGQGLGDTASRYAYYEDVNGQPGESVYDHPALRNESEVVTYTGYAVAPFTNQIAEEVFADGRADHYGYELGTYSGGAFTAGSGAYLRKTITHGTDASPEGITEKTTREILILSPGGLVLEEQAQVYLSGSYVPVTKTVHGYNAEGRLTSSTKDGRVLYEAAWTGNRKDWEKDEQGIPTTYTAYDALGRVQTESRQGISTTYTYDAEDRVRSVTRTGGGLTLTSSTGYDAAGRVTSETTEEGLTTTTTYTNGGRTVTRTLPSGGTEITDHYADGTVKSITGTGVIAKYYDYGADANGQWTQEFVGSAASPRWTKTYTNVLGDLVREERPGYTGTTLASIITVDLRGLRTGRTVPGEAAELFEYDELGQLSRQGRDVNGNGTLDVAGTDEVTDFSATYATDSGYWCAVRSVSRYEGADGAPTPFSSQKSLFGGGGATMLDRTVQVDRYGKATTTTSVVNRATQTVTATTVASDSSTPAVATTVAGRLISASTTTVAQPTSYEYDGLGRLDKMTDPRGVITDPVYTGAFLTSQTVAGQSTSYQYVPAGQPGAGQLFTTTYADGKTEVRGYDLRGFLTGISGTGVYKMTLTIDSYGDRTELYTYRTAGASDKTTWTYNPATGLLTTKTDAAVKHVQYDYTADNHLFHRTNARNIVTIYAFDERGNVKTMDYADATPDVSITYDRINRPAKVTDAAGKHLLGYTLGEESEAITLGPLAGVANSRKFDASGRVSAVTGTTGSWGQSVSYQYDPSSRLQTVKMGVFGTATYGYVPNSDLLLTTTFTGGMTSTRLWDGSNRLQKITHTAAAGTRSLDTTQFDSRNRRKEIAWDDGSKWTIGYDDLGQVTSGGRKWSDASAVEGQQYGYAYDGAGNRSGATGTTVNGRTATYTANALNQITSRTVPGAVDVMGSANPGATVTVNGAATSRKGGYFYKLLTASNTSGPVSVAETIAATLASGTTTRARTALVAKTPESFGYDNDGNLVSDGLWSYSWDAENRLVAMESVPTVPAAQKRKLTFRYDWQGRRVEKFVYQWVNSAWLLHDHTRFLWNGWLLQAEVGDAGQPIRSYAWGLDASGSLEAAGGVGGLLLERNYYANKTFEVASDLNGNVIRLVDTSNGQSVADYEYGPFGEVIRASGEYAALNPFGFSSKFTDWETGLLYYGYRYYNPETGRWLSLDPIGEKGGLNLYGFVGNDLVNHLDPFGLCSFIAVTGSEIQLGLKHAILVYFKGDFEADLNKHYTLSEIQSGGGEINASVDLMRSPSYGDRAENDWKIWRRTDHMSAQREWSTWSEDRVAIAYMRYLETSGDDVAAVFMSQDDEEMDAKWRELVQIAKAYKYASQDPNSPQNWPNSKYSDPFTGEGGLLGLAPGNNSNTFVKYATKRMGWGVKWESVLPGRFLGNSSPKNVINYWPGQVPVPANQPLPPKPR